jgi:hypothetical protein
MIFIRILIFRVGGKVLQIEWDPTGERLAVLFAASNYIPILGLLPGRDTSLLPLGFICGREGEHPVAIAFQKNFQHGALLTIVRFIIKNSARLIFFVYFRPGPASAFNISHSYSPTS